MISSILRDRPPPVTELRSDLPADLARIVSHSLRKDREHRYQTAKDVRNELEELLQGLETERMSGSEDRVTGAGAKPRRFWIPMGVIAVALIVLLAWSAGWLGERPVADGHAGIESLVVLPLENLSGDPTQEYFADGMTEVLITELAQIGSLKGISRTSAMQYKSADKPLPLIARELAVDAVVEGSVLVVEDRVRVTVQLIRAKTDEHLWANSYERDLREVLTLQAELARAIAQRVRARLTPEELTRLSGEQPVEPRAFEAYLRGRFFWNKRTVDDLRKGMEHFWKAVELDPSYALPHVGLADSYHALSFYGLMSPLEAYPRVKAEALRALEIDNTLAEPHTALGSFHQNYTWDWTEAEREQRMRSR